MRGTNERMHPRPSPGPDSEPSQQRRRDATARVAGIAMPPAPGIVPRGAGHPAEGQLVFEHDACGETGANHPRGRAGGQGAGIHRAANPGLSPESC